MKDVFIIKLSIILLLCISFSLDVSAQFDSQISPQYKLRGTKQNVTSRRVTSFNNQKLYNVYQHRGMQQQYSNVEYQYRANLSTPDSRKISILSNLESQTNYHSRLVLGGVSKGYYTTSPKKITDGAMTNISYSSFPVINSRGEVVYASYDESVVKIGPQQALPGDWAEPGPIGDFAFPMLLLAICYVFLIYKKSKN